MKKLIIAAALLFLFTGLSIGQTPTALEVIKKADEKNRGLSSKATMTMTIERPKWSRSITMKTWSKGSDYFLIYISAPAKEKGKVFLKRKKEMWNWVPSIDRMIKLPASMMMQSWMGSDFKNDDLVQQSSIVVDYTHKMLGVETINGQECYKIELIPNEDAPVVWGKIISWITVDGYNQWKTEFYDEDMYLVNTEVASDLKKMGDRIIPTRVEITPEDEPGNKTILVIENMEFNIRIDESFFSQQNMKRIR